MLTVQAQRAEGPRRASTGRLHQHHRLTEPHLGLSPLLVALAETPRHGARAYGRGAHAGGSVGPRSIAGEAQHPREDEWHVPLHPNGDRVVGHVRSAYFDVLKLIATDPVVHRPLARLLFSVGRRVGQFLDASQSSGVGSVLKLPLLVQKQPHIDSHSRDAKNRHHGQSTQHEALTELLLPERT